MMDWTAAQIAVPILISFGTLALSWWSSRNSASAAFTETLAERLEKIEALWAKCEGDRVQWQAERVELTAKILDAMSANMVTMTEVTQLRHQLGQLNNNQPGK